MMEKYKDPAFLFYPESFLVGVMDMTDEEVGQYIKLMCRQHQKGHLPTAVIEKASEAVREKFVQDDDGRWYNVRLETEMEKRAKWTSSRRKNLEGKKHDDEQKPTKKKETVADWIAETVPAELHDAFIEWAQMRAKQKKPVPSKRSVERNYSQLVKLAKSVDNQKKIIEQSVDKCWTGFYPLKTEEPKPKAYKEFEKEKEIDAVPMPDEIKRKADALGIRIGE
jgi:hypothetical protein